MQENNNTMELQAQKARLTLTGERELLCEGMAQAVQVHFTLSRDWDNLTKIAVFSNGTVSVDVPEAQWSQGLCTVPKQVLACAGKTVRVGLYGTDGEQVVLPTVWCSLGRVEPGTVPACSALSPTTLPLWAQLAAQVEHFAETQPAILNPEDLSLADLEAVSVPAMLNVSGTVMPMAAHSTGVAAEFIGSPVLQDGRYVFPKYTLTPQGITASAIPITTTTQFSVTLTRGTDDSLTIDKTAAQIIAAAQAGLRVILTDADGRSLALREISGTTARFCEVIEANSAAVYALCYTVSGSSVTRTARILYQKPSTGISLNDLSDIVRAGIGRYPVYITVESDHLVASKTPAEIYAAFNQGADLYAVEPNGQQLSLLFCAQSSAVFCGLTSLMGSNAIDILSISGSGVAYEHMPLQGSGITDSGSYFQSSTVEGALQEIGAALSGVNALVGGGIG